MAAQKLRRETKRREKREIEENEREKERERQERQLAALRVKEEQEQQGCDSIDIYYFGWGNVRDTASVRQDDLSRQ